MKKISLIFPYYENPDMFRKQQEIIRDYPLDIRANLHVLTCDDGSPTKPQEDALDPDFPKAVGFFAMFKTLVDVRWNWLFCRNLCVHHARTEWILHTDIDHTVPESTMRALMEGEHNPSCVFTFERVDAPGMTPYKPHPNSWFMTKKMYEKVGGYDERFSGFYGTDSDFRNRCEGAAKAVRSCGLPLVRWPREVLADASTTTYERKAEYDKPNVKRIKAEREKDPNWRPRTLSFPWKRII